MPKKAALARNSALLMKFQAATCGGRRINVDARRPSPSRRCTRRWHRPHVLFAIGRNENSRSRPATSGPHHAHDGRAAQRGEILKNPHAADDEDGLRKKILA
jgi:hypothetical protein